MTQIEKPSFSQKLRICVDRSSQLDIFEQVRTAIANGGLTKESRETIADLPVDGLSVESIIQLNIDEGNLLEKDGVIVPNRREVR